MSKNTNQAPFTLKVPGNDYPYLNCTLEDGRIQDIGKETVVFTTVSKAGNKRRVTLHPNGTVIEEQLESEAA